MKKYLSLVLTIVLALALVPNVAMATRVGDVVGYAQPTDIVATINGYQLESYNVDGYTYICVEDLRYYGFNVYYDNYTRSLSFSRNGATYIDPQNTNPNFWNIGNNNTRRPILHTDIVTYANGSYVGSANINGQTIIQFDHLRAFGAVNYDNTKREISLVLSDVYYNPVATLANSIGKDLSNYAWDSIVRAKGNMLTIKNVSKEFSSTSEIGNIPEFSLRVQSGDIYQNRKQALDTFRSKGYDISSLYEVYYTKKGQKVVDVQIY